MKKMESEETANKAKAGNESQGNLNTSESDTTIYQNMLKKVTSTGEETIVDSEITFKNRELLPNALLLAMKDLFMKKMESEETANKAKAGNESQGNLNTSESDTTIYQNMLKKVTSTGEETIVDSEITFKNREPLPNALLGNNDRQHKQTAVCEEHRFSSSSEEHVNTSDELMDVDLDFNERFIADCEAEAKRRKCSYPEDDDKQIQDETPRDKSEKNKTNDVIREAEASRARILTTPGKVQRFANPIREENYDRLKFSCSATQHSTIVDENYLIIGSHIDEVLHEKIKRSEYIYFARLLPRERTSVDDGRLELVHKNGQTYFLPVAERDIGNISSFGKWEQAFRVFSNIYTSAFPDRATELIQYNHIIFTASMSYQWDNVYTYDCELRRHLSHFPDRSWAIILQQAWTMHLKDRVINHGHSGGRFGNNNGNQRNKKEISQRFNKGLCTAGRNCKFDHRCLECGKFGHRMHICRKRLNNQAKGSSGETSTSGVADVKTSSSHTMTAGSNR